MDPDCIFCKIVNRDASADLIYQDDRVTAFRDIHPVAPIHILIVPNKHIPSVNEVLSKDEATLGHLFTIAAKLAEQEGVRDSGYRLIVNTGDDGGQVVYHVHLHLIGGRRMRHPMG